MSSPSANGLNGIVVAKTTLSDVDGERGRLVICGHPVGDLVKGATFEDACGLMWHAAYPSTSERDAERLLCARHPERGLRANVEFYTAVLLEVIGIPRTLFSPTFAASRVAGWCAHVDEQRRVGRLIRPASTYVGP